MVYLLGLSVGYCLGCINPAYSMARLKGFDIREYGSKNAGASNVLITMGMVGGCICAVLDVAKAALAVWLMKWLFPDVDTFAITATACILGHIFPFYLGFRGGKGLACLGGAILAFSLRVFVILLILELLIALLTKYICYVPITASILFTFLYAYTTGDLWGSALWGVVAIVILYKHLVNLQRIMQGRELRLSYLWARDRETMRVKGRDSGSNDT